MKKPNVSKVSKKPSLFEKRVAELREHRRKIAAFSDKHERILDEWEELQEKEKTLVDLLKSQARHEFEARGKKPGDSEVFVDEDGLFISATQPRVKFVPVSDAYERAVDLGLRDMAEVFKLDVKAASEILDASYFSELVEYGEPPTVAVTIK